MIPFVFLVAFAAIAFTMTAAFHFRDKSRLRWLMQERQGEGFQEFAQYFSAEDIPEDILRAVYQFFQGYAAVRNFPVRAVDRIALYGPPDDDDVSSAILRIAEKCGCRRPSTAECARMPFDKVEDMVRLIFHFRAH